MTVNIMIAAGGTGGHVFPALAVAQALRDQHYTIHWLGSPKGIENRVVPDNNFTLHVLSISGVRGSGIARLIKAPIMLMGAIWQAISVLRKIKPKAILGMGGFAAGPGCVAAKLLGIPVIVHEQNAIPGVTNTLSAKIATYRLEAFEGAFATKNVKGAQFVGNPIRQAIAETESSYAVHQPARILIIGGSLGAIALNELVPNALMLASQQTVAFEVRHQCGRGRANQVQAAYEAATFNAEVSDFIDDMAAAYQWADIVICRAGAMTVAELAATGRPAIFIPYPYAVDDHQTANAQWLATRGAALVYQQHQLDEKKLSSTLVNLLSDQHQLREMAAAALDAAKLDATNRVATIVKEAANG